MARTSEKKAAEERAAKQAAFLEAYSRSGNVSYACKVAGIGRQTHYDWLQSDVAYKRVVEHAREDAADRLETEAFRRAYKGVSKPVYQGGALVGHVQEYSDTLIMFLLRGMRPEKFREKSTRPDGEKPEPIKKRITFK